MSTTISNGSTTWTALILTELEDAREGRNVFHSILGTNERSVSFRPGALSTGTFQVLMATRALASALRDAVADGQVLTLDSTELPDLNMTFVLAGQAGLMVHEDDRSKWWVTVEYEAVS